MSDFTPLLTDEQIDAIAINGGHFNAAGGIYSTSVYAFAKEAAHAAVLADRKGREQDSKRLDWLDEQNRRKNERHGSRYGWQYSENHNRIALEDHGYPARPVRRAIDLAMASQDERDAQRAKEE
jgi:hypothetical protein